ncbi:hypothetical protein [Pimelobacter simplex]|uniref:hypothetical protein n=1 Tax=Nocardioides simplex TaxID=2045 RepID=UPI00214F8FAB|nr:hypothetical protein [Pimelobacter simplex]UUW88457.1 hypothetical protein M0M43_22320 [Pimelobacter simplex]UUW97961.1 hypothetical protein M0M48_10965 [Pimelobacter simplex]
MPDWPQGSVPDAADLLTEVAALNSDNSLLRERLADLELAAEDVGWERASTKLLEEFSRQGLQRVTRNCRVMAVASPLIKRGIQLRAGYIWGQGVTVQARAAGEDAGQDVNAVVQAWWDDESNQKALTSSQAQEELERALGTDGQVFIACFTNQLTGRVQVRSTPFEEILDVVNNPDDRDDPWFYLREYNATVVERGYSGLTRLRPETRRVFHPALGFWPATRPKSVDGIPVQWDVPILHVPVNRLDGWKWGVPDVYASLPWARAYEGFLTDWARLCKALSKFAWKLTGDRAPKVRSAVARMQSALPADVPPIGGSDAGGVAAMGPGANLEAIPKTGATIDSDSGRPLAALAAAGLGLPVTTLLSDPGTTGARAVAETLEQPTILEMGMRRELWGAVLQQLAAYAVDQAVKAPQGPLRGVVQQVGTRQVVTLAGDVEKTVVVEWPDLNELDPLKMIEAIVAADSTGVVPGLETLRLLLTALRVKDVDEVLKAVTDEQGNFVDPRIEAAAAAIARQREAA